MPKLKNEKHEAFCWKYVECLEATKAYRHAFSTTEKNKKGSTVSAHKLMKMPTIIKRIDELMAERSERVKVSVDSVLQQLVNSINFDITEIVNEVGELDIGALKEMPVEMRRMVESVKTISSRTDTGLEILNTSVKLLPKMKAIELLFKHLGMTHNNEKENVNITIEQIVREGVKGDK